MRNLFKLSKEKSTKLKKQAIKQAMIRYYNTVNQGRFALPSFLLADLAILRTGAFFRINELYEKLVG